MRKILGPAFYILLATVVLVSCKKNNIPEEIIPASGFITGKIVSANHNKPIRNATVFTYYGGKAYITHSDVNGSFTLEAPSGNRHLTIQTGDGSMFRTEMDVVITEGQTTSIAAQAVSLNQVASLAYVAGTYDKIEEILIDSMGYTATPLVWGQLSSLSNISSFDAIFINCTSQSNFPSPSYQTDSTLADYVANGGSLYVSDWAVRALIGSQNGANDPCGMGRPGGFIADSLLCTRRTGPAGSLIPCPIVSASLQAYLNKTFIDQIVYNLPEWEKINYLDQNFWETIVTDAGGLPLLIRTNNYSTPPRQSVHIGSAANNGYSLVCYEGITLSVKANEASVMVAAGASMGMCNNLNGSGRIYFTTFHNEPNGIIGPDIRNILEYVILNL